jgi:hypothetical protein
MPVNNDPSTAEDPNHFFPLMMEMTASGGPQLFDPAQFNSPLDLSRPIVDSSSDSFGGSGLNVPVENKIVFQDVFIGAGTPKQNLSFDIGESPSELLPSITEPIYCREGSINSPLSILYDTQTNFLSGSGNLP